MKISDLIRELTTALQTFGDLPIEDDIELLFSIQYGSLRIR